MVYQILGNFWARYAHLINHRNIHDEYFTVVLSNGQPTFLSTILSFALVYRSTDNLRLTILCHSFFNFLNHAKPIWIFVYNYIYYHFFR
ncbi:TPA: hypothetical protein VWD07_000846 [Streptococcus pneumoniae]|nr:hypothetical protein [Streptococcus pneumoniae]